MCFVSIILSSKSPYVCGNSLMLICLVNKFSLLLHTHPEQFYAVRDLHYNKHCNKN